MATYYKCYFTVYENSDLADNEGSFRKHLLLEFLHSLNIIKYSKHYDVVYEITVNMRK